MEPTPVPWVLRHPVATTALGSLVGGMLVGVAVAISGAGAGTIALTVVGAAAAILALFAFASWRLRRPVLPLILTDGSLGPLRPYGGEGGGDGGEGWTEVHSADHWIGGDFGGGGGDGGGG